MFFNNLGECESSFFYNNCSNCSKCKIIDKLEFYNNELYNLELEYINIIKYIDLIDKKTIKYYQKEIIFIKHKIKLLKTELVKIN